MEAAVQALDLAKVFRLTKQQPGLYWLPLSEEQRAAKADAKQQKEQSRHEPHVA